MGAKFRRLCKMFDRYQSMLQGYIAREYKYLVALGAIDEEVLSQEDILDEAMLEAWHERHHRPAQMSDRAWLRYAVRRALARLIRQARPTSTEDSLEDIIADPEMDDQLWVYWAPDEINTLEDTIPDELSPVVEDTALQEIELELVGRLLPTLPALQRESFEYLLVQEMPLAEVAQRLDATPEVVQHAAEQARIALLSALRGA